MWFHGVLILTVVAYAFGKVKVQKAKFGDTVTLQAEPGTTQWKRVKSDGTTEYVQHCGEGRGLGCNMFADDRGGFSCPTSGVTVFPNGTLTLQFLWQGDAYATYSSRDATKEVGF
ncbi:hypothetical protein Y032_0015g2845 [Ancylostoma ceylanicum]|uniref:Uncharacterized protein n=1 Tax=Ancylostoma ceylanicum TaxID=53326 RepID=A0A016V8N7_9BILA|nr:hypothetical protein Y032_0015g2845 [Ancylostoma ceylanicum]